MKNNLIRNIVVVLMLLSSLFVLTACQKNNENNVDSELAGLKEYKQSRLENYTEYNGSVGAKFSYPSSWLSTGTDDKPIYMNTDGSGTSVNLSSADYMKTMTFENFIEASKAGIVEKMTVKGDVKDEMINLNGRKACRLDYVTENEQKSEDGSTSEKVDISIIQIVFVEDDKVYILTIATMDPEGQTETIENIIKSFKKD